MSSRSLFNTIINDLTQIPYERYTFYPLDSYYDKSYKIFEEEDKIIFKCLAPGIDKDNLDISFDKDFLVIKSLYKIEKDDFKIKLDKKIYLDKTVDASKSFASLEQGILTITMPLNQKNNKQKISFK